MTMLALFDVDGTITNDLHRVEYALKGEWIEYFRPDRVAADSNYPEAKATVQQMQALNYQIGYLTGRRDTLRQITENWLDEEEYPVGRLVMRRPNQKKRLAVFKAEYILRLLESGNFSDVVLFDDDHEVVSVVQETCGFSHAVLCTWHTKPEALIKKATA